MEAQSQPRNLAHALRARSPHYLICTHVNSNEITTGARECFEIAATVVDLASGGSLIDEYATFIRPQGHGQLRIEFISSTGVQQTDLDKAMSFPEFCLEFREQLVRYAPSYLWCAWGMNDGRSIVRDCSRWVVPMPLDPRRHFNLQAWLAGAQGLSEPKPPEALARYDLEWRGDANRAISVTRNLAALAVYLVRRKSFSVNASAA